MADRTASIVPPLGDLCTVQIDPQWPYRAIWREDTELGEKLSFAFIDLSEGFSENVSPNYADTDVVGRAEQYKTFVGTSNREIPLTFRFQAQGLPTTALSADIAAVCEAEVVAPALWLDALKHPVVDAAGLSHAPPPVLLTVGRLIPAARCIVTQADVTWKEPFDPETLLPYGAEVQVVFTVVRRAIRRTALLGRFGPPETREA